MGSFIVEKAASLGGVCPKLDLLGLEGVLLGQPGIIWVLGVRKYNLQELQNPEKIIAYERKLSLELLGLDEQMRESREFGEVVPLYRVDCAIVPVSYTHLK